MRMSRIQLNDLPNWSPWVATSLGLDSWSIPSRDAERVDREYDKDKYAKCLDYYLRTGGDVTVEDVKQFEDGVDTADKICISSFGDLYEVGIGDARSRYYRLVSNTLSEEVGKCKTVVELGAGYGVNLWMLRQRFSECSFLGGEYSKNAVELSTRLFEDDERIRVKHFNFYEADSYELLDQAEPPIIVFTSHAVEQLHSWSEPFFSALLRRRDIISSVIHFEPVYQLQDETLLGLLRRRYIEINDYNRDLLPELQQNSAVRIVSVVANPFGINPLNPTTVIRWEFATS